MEKKMENEMETGVIFKQQTKPKINKLRTPLFTASSGASLSTVYFWGYNGIMEKKMETTIMGLYRDYRVGDTGKELVDFQFLRLGASELILDDIEAASAGVENGKAQGLIPLLTAER